MKVDIVKACNEIYGKQNKENWPGDFRTNLNEYGNACFGSVARLYNFESNSQVLSTPEGQECQKAMYTQLKLNGKNPCANWLSVPVIDLPPRVSFFNRIKKGSTNNQAYNIYNQCLLDCETDECKKNVYLDYLAWKLDHITIPKPIKPEPIPKPIPTPTPTPTPTLRKHHKSKKHHKKHKGCKNCDNTFIYLIVGFALLLIVFFVIFAKYPPLN